MENTGISSYLIQYNPVNPGSEEKEINTPFNSPSRGGNTQMLLYQGFKFC